MTVETFLNDRISIMIGDVHEQLRLLPSDHFDCVVTSPPYWGLRSYLPEGHEDKHKEIGCERTLGEHLAVMVDVFNEVRRVMKPSATLWLNYGDCFATTPNGRSAADTKAAGNDDRTFRDKPFSTVGAIQARSNGGEGQHHDRRGAVYEPDHENGDRRGTSGNKGSNGQAAHNGRVVAGGYLKSGDLCMIPNRLAIALQDAGWWVKSEIIWGKTNPMPDSSGAVRPSTAHEKVWLLSKSDSCPYYRARDTGEIRDDPDLSEMVPMITTGELGARWIRMPFFYDAATVKIGRSSDEDANTFRGGSYVGGKPGKRMVTGNKHVDKQRGHSRRHAGFNDRWDQMTKEEQCSNGRFLRNYEPAPLTVWPMATQSFSEAHFATFPPELAERCILAGCPIGGNVLDPFGGAGTTALVAATFGRTATLIELNPEYAVMARARIEAAFMGKEEGIRHMVKQLGKLTMDAGPLFQSLG
jgi:DNA modification methylase